LQSALRLDLHFDPLGLQLDLAEVLAGPWIRHFDTGIYRGDWKGLALRGPADARHPIQALHNAPGTKEFRDQPVLADCPHIRRVMASLQCPLQSVRLLRLAPGAVIDEHTDHELGYAFGEVRLHLPVVTNADVDFRVMGKRVVMQAGELWYLDASRPHSVANKGDADRVHLVLDCVLNPWLDQLLQEGEAPPDEFPAETTALPATRPTDVAPLMRSRFDEPITGQILDFLAEIGLETASGSLPKATFLPGIYIERGAIRIDPGRLAYPGDLLHEAGHLAVLPSSERATCTGMVDNGPADEMMAIAWSWAALIHLGLPPQEVFHGDGYKGDSDWLIETYRGGSFIGLPMLQWIGLAADAERAAVLGVKPYPHMLRWLRE
jgi:hypothetical protein